MFQDGVQLSDSPDHWFIIVASLANFRQEGGFGGGNEYVSKGFGSNIEELWF